MYLSPQKKPDQKYQLFLENNSLTFATIPQNPKNLAPKMTTEAEITGNCVHYEVYERQLPAAYRLDGGWQHRLARRGGSYRLLRNGPAEPPQTHATLLYRAVSPSIMNSREFKGIQGNFH